MKNDWQTAGWNQAAREIDKWRRKIKFKGDYWWKKVESFTNDGDYLPSDEGEAPKRAEV